MYSTNFVEKLRLIPLRPHFWPNLVAPRVVRPRYSHLTVIAFFLLTFLIAFPELATCQTSEQQVEDTFRAGQAALKQGDFVRAAQEFRKVLELDPNLLEAEVNLGLAYQSLFDYESAVRHLARALRERPNLFGLNVIVGMDYIKLGSPEKAIPFLQHAVKLDPSNRDVHEAMALYYLSQENFRGAGEEFRQIAALDPDKAEAWFKLGHEYLDLAARLAYRGARLYPDSAWGHRFLGDLLFERSRWDDASKEYGKALTIEPRQPGLHTLLGESYLRAGKRDEAERAFHLELQLDSRTELAWLGLANLQLAKDQPLGALESVDKVWKIFPEFLKLRPEFPSIELTEEAAKASISRLLDQPEGAAKHFVLAGLYAFTNETALSDREWKSFQNDSSRWQKTSNASPKTHTNQDPCKAHLYSRCIESLQSEKHLTQAAQLRLGKTYFILQQYERAAGALAQIHGDANENAEASYWLERTYQALGTEAYAGLENSFPNSWRTHQLRAEGYVLGQDPDDALKEYQLALQLRPDEAELREALGEFYLDNHHHDGEAETQLQKALSLDPSRTKALYLLGRLYVLSRENEKAVPYLQRALRLQPNLNEASGLLGTAYVRMGRFADAIPKLEKATALDHFGNLHYQLYLAYRKLGQAELAQKALARSQELRRSSLEHDQVLILGSPQVESEPQ
jgi:tetratricopeptide (TPR) repeat protein